ncbi:MAG: Ig-like domain-containing protein [Bacilli bacterium]|nr:Ig-like domain-containing protein [Bacilli bacterium]
MKKNIKALLITALFTLTTVMGCSQIPLGKTTRDNSVASITLDPSAVTLELTQMLELTPHVEMADENETYDLDNLRWVTSNPFICEVEKGMILATGCGTAYISAIANNKFATCTVVVPEIDVPVSTFTISESNISVRTSSTYQLAALLDGSDVSLGAEWKSSDETIANVDMTGIVTGVSEGNAVITASFLTYTATCNVTVSNDAPVIFTLSITPSAVNLVEKGDPGIVSAVISDPTYPISWASENEKIATVEYDSTLGVAIIHPIKEGTTNITATANNKVAKCLVTVAGEDVNKTETVYFFLDGNNVDPEFLDLDDPNKEDESGSKLLAKFKWYPDIPLKNAPIPKNPTTPSDPAFPYFIGWSAHSVIDQKSDLWNMETDLIGNVNSIYLYGIWSDVKEFSK